jgi:hypothetical protein
MMSENCLICGTVGVEPLPTLDNYSHFRCSVCGEYKISGTALAIENDISSFDQHQKAVLCSIVYDYYKNKQEPFFIKSGNVNSELINAQSKNPAEILNRLIEFLYRDQYHLDYLEISDFKLYPILQTFDKRAIKGYFEELNEQKITKSFSHSSNQYVGWLTLKGFEVYEELKKGKSKSNQVFMALQFKSKAETFYKNSLIPALKEFKLDLKDIRDLSNMGELLVAQMEAEIRQSKFLIADITPSKDEKCPDINIHNANVYWEAGFARGLEKPVLLLCEASKFEKLPFDTNGFLHVKYDLSSEEKIKEAIKEIQAKIYNTFPNELVLPSSRTVE